MHLLATLAAQVLQKSLDPIQRYDSVSLLGPKWCIYPEEEFFAEKPLT